MNQIAELPNQEVLVFNALQTALEKGVDADSLEKVLNMQERILDRQSEQAYAQSMVEAQTEMPVIEHNKTNTHTSSTYSDMGQIIKQITPIYTKHGFALSFGSDKSPEPGHVRVVCDVMHSQGHSKPYSADIPLDVDGISGNPNKTAVHGTGSAFTYGQRYLTKLIFNLNTGDDDDGNSAGGDERSALEVENWWIEHMGKLRNLTQSIHRIKQGIQNNKADPEKYGLEPAVEAWMELEKDEAEVLWRPAPTKGGILTTYERETIQSNEWVAIRSGMG